MKEFKMCPLLIGREEHKAITYGSGDYIIPTFYPCIGDKCMAYRGDGICKYWKTRCTKVSVKE